MFVNGPIRIDDTGIEQVPNQWSVYKTQHEKKLKPDWRPCKVWKEIYMTFCVQAEYSLQYSLHYNHRSIKQQHGDMFHSTATCDHKVLAVAVIPSVCH